jgi:hypothetical protein
VICPFFWNKENSSFYRRVTPAVFWSDEKKQNCPWRALWRMRPGFPGCFGFFMVPDEFNQVSSRYIGGGKLTVSSLSVLKEREIRNAGYRKFEKLWSPTIFRYTQRNRTKFTGEYSSVLHPALHSGFIPISRIILYEGNNG